MENYLCERKGNAGHTEYFPELEEIRRTNVLLGALYGYVKENYDDIIFITTEDCGMYFADTGYEHGCIPSQPNEAAAMRIAGRIRRKVFGD